MGLRGDWMAARPRWVRCNRTSHAADPVNAFHGRSTAAPLTLAGPARCRPAAAKRTVNHLPWQSLGFAFHYKCCNIGTVSTQNEQKLKKFLDRHRAGTVCLAAWLEKSGISRDLQKRYRRSGWLESIGKSRHSLDTSSILLSMASSKSCPISPDKRNTRCFSALKIS